MHLYLGFAIGTVPSRCDAIELTTKKTQTLAERKAEFLAEAVDLPFFTEITQVIIRDDKKVIFAEALSSSEHLGRAINKLNELFLEHAEHCGHIPFAYGFNIKYRLRQLAIQGARVGIPLAPELWFTQVALLPTCYDPYDYAVRSEEQKYLTLERLCQYLELPSPAGMDTNPAFQAELASMLVNRMGKETI